ncbi:PEK, partial [Symbiodinium microadriaticum]
PPTVVWSSSMQRRRVPSPQASKRRRRWRRFKLTPAFLPSDRGRRRAPPRSTKRYCTSRQSSAARRRCRTGSPNATPPWRLARPRRRTSRPGPRKLRGSSARSRVPSQRFMREAWRTGT